ncbi:MAG: tyrosine-type recombinase/integrase, partial [Aestuariivirgaceae bacterium]
LAHLSRRGSLVFGYETRHSIYKPWRVACKAAEIQYTPPHQAGRHSFATEMIIRNKVDIATVARLGNWKSHRVLSENYAHPENEGDMVDEVFSTQKSTKKGKQIGKGGSK